MLAVLRTAGVVQDVHQGAQLQSHAYVETSSGLRTQFLTRHGYRYDLTHPLMHQQGREHHCIHGTTRSNGFDSGGVRAGVVVVVVVRPGIV